MKWSLVIFLILIKFLANSQCPSISKQPQSQTDCDGNSIRMMCEASMGSSFQWERKRPQDAIFSVIVGANASSFQIFPSGDVNSPTGTSYRVKVSLNTCAIFSQIAEISLNKVSNILNPSICERGSGILEVQIPESSASRAISYQWTRAIGAGNFQDLSDDTNFQGSQTRNLFIKNAPITLQGQRFKIRIQYSITLNNDNEGSLNNENQVASCPRTSNEVVITIKSSPQPLHSSTLYTGCVNASISINSTGCSPYVTQWYDENENKLGTGAKISVTQMDLNPKIYKATCLKLGCESLPSLGTSAQSFKVPSAPMNTGTPTSISTESTIIFKASGGTNNIWYVNENDTKAISTASSITVPLPINSGPSAIEIVRWVSQKINNCESEKTAIRVTIPGIKQNIVPTIPTVPAPSTPPVVPPLVVPPMVVPPLITPPMVVPPMLSPPLVVPPIIIPPMVVPPMLSPPIVVPPMVVPPKVVPPMVVPPIIIPPLITPPMVVPPLVVPPKVVPPMVIPPIVVPPMVVPPLLSPPMVVSPIVVPPLLVPLPVILPLILPAGNPEHPIIPADAPIDLIGLNPSEQNEPEKPDIKEIPIPKEKLILRYSTQLMCQEESYLLHVEGCPVALKYENLRGGIDYLSPEVDLLILSPDQTRIVVTCEGEFSDPLSIILPGLRSPVFSIEKNFESFVCENEIIDFKLNFSPDAQFRNWEKDGHSYTENSSIRETANAGVYQAIIQKEGCFYRSDFLTVDVHNLPKPPNLFSLFGAICQKDTLQILIKETANKYLWDIGNTTKSISFIGKKAGLETFKAKISLDSQCWSDWSISLKILVHPNPEKPQILTIRNAGFCRGDSTLLQTTRLAKSWKWLNGETKPFIYSKIPQSYTVMIQDSMNCWSPQSDSITSFYFPIQKQPVTKSFPSNQFCMGDFVTLKTSPAFGYLWSTGQTSDSINVKQSGKYQLKTKNEYGCWSIPSTEQWLYGRTLPLMPILEKNGTFFIKARNFDLVDSYQWIVGPAKLTDTNAILKMAVNGLHQVRAKRNFNLETNPLLSCFSEFQKVVFNIPENFNGFSIYPNPMIGDFLKIEILKEMGRGQIRMADMRGVTLGVWPIENSNEALKIKINSIPNGQYIIKIISENVILDKLLIINK